MTPSYQYPEPLAGHHNLSGFRCRSSEQTDWLLRYSRQSAATGTTRVFVVTEHGDDRVVAYYAWCMAQVHAGAAPVRLRKGAGRYPQPVALLARLGVDGIVESQIITSGTTTAHFLATHYPAGTGVHVLGGAGFVSAGLAIYLINWLFRAGASGDRERESEDAAREYFDLHGRWPD